jgi:hypothetical protein
MVIRPDSFGSQSQLGLFEQPKSFDLRVFFAR